MAKALEIISPNEIYSDLIFKDPVSPHTIDRKKVAFEAGLGTPKQPTISFGRTHMVRVGQITFSDAN